MFATRRVRTAILAVLLAAVAAVAGQGSAHAAAYGSTHRQRAVVVVPNIVPDVLLARVVRQDTIVTIELHEDSDGGYTWINAGSPAQVGSAVTFLGTRVLASAGLLIGAGVTRLIRYRAVRHGTAVITLSERRVWEPAAVPARQVVLHILVT